MIFSEWYNAQPVLDQPQYKDMVNEAGTYRIVFSINPELWSLSDWKVRSACGSVVHMVKSKPTLTK
jgi:hypothetical protein